MYIYIHIHIKKTKSVIKQFNNFINTENYIKSYEN